MELMARHTQSTGELLLLLVVEALSEEIGWGKEMEGGPSLEEEGGGEGWVAYGQCSSCSAEGHARRMRI